MSPEVLPPEEIIAKLIKAFGEKTPIQSVEFGYDEDDERKWWAKAIMRSGRARFAEITLAPGDDLRMGPINALAELGRELGLSIRIREQIDG